MPMKRPRATFAPSHPTRAEHTNPLLALLTLLPSLPITRTGAIDFKRSNPTVLMQIVDHAEQSVESLNLGLSAVGNIWAFAAPEIEDGTVPLGSVEAIGWLLATLSECAASLMVLSAECRRAAGAVA